MSWGLSKGGLNNLVQDKFYLEVGHHRTNISIHLNHFWGEAFCYYSRLQEFSILRSQKLMYTKFDKLVLFKKSIIIIYFYYDIV
jgi:hypothetical protein